MDYVPIFVAYFSLMPILWFHIIIPMFVNALLLRSRNDKLRFIGFFIFTLVFYFKLPADFSRIVLVNGVRHWCRLIFTFGSCHKFKSYVILTFSTIFPNADLSINLRSFFENDFWPLLSIMCSGLFCLQPGFLTEFDYPMHFF